MLTLETFKIAAAIIIAIFAIVRMRTTKAQQANNNSSNTNTKAGKPNIPAGTFHHTDQWR
jgi:hypothetical protein